MKTPPCLKSASRCCALLIAVAAVSEPARAADPPRSPPPAREGFFARLFSRDRTSEAASASRKKQTTGGARPVMGSNVAGQTRYEQLAVNAPAPSVNVASANAKRPSTPASQVEPRTGTPTTQPSPQTGTNAPQGTAAGSQPTPSSAAAPGSAKVFPTATFLGYGRVRVPFAPFSTLDVTGLPSGSLAKDPVSGQIFRVP